MENLIDTQKAEVNVGRQRAKGTNVNSIEKAIEKRRAAAKGAAVTEEPREVQVSTVIGKIKLIDPNTVNIGERLRSDSESDPDLERSIKAMGKFVRSSCESRICCS